MRSQSRPRAVEFGKSTILTDDLTPMNKVEFIRKGKKKKTITGFKENKNITFENKGGKFIMVEKEKKFEEAAVTQKKRNYIKFESKLGTEKETDLTKIAGVKKKREVEPRTEEKIIQTKKKNEYLDNYQYHESKVIRNPKPNKISLVEHKRLGDIIGGSFEETTYERQTVTTDPSGKQSILRQRQTTTTKNQRGGLPNKQSVQTFNRTVKREMKPYSSQTNLRPASNIGKINATPSNARISRGKDKTPATEYKKVEKRTVTRGGQTTTTTRTTTSRGKGNLRK